MQQLITAACSAGLELVSGLAELGRIYLGLLQPDNPQRIVITAQDPTAGEVSVKFLDSLTSGRLAIGQLRHCPDQLLNWPPAAVTAASLTVKTRLVDEIRK